METRSNHVLVGAVMLALLAIVLGFTVWLARVSGGDAQIYDIFFRQSVAGLANGSAVTFAGVPAGQVTEIKLIPDQPEFVRVRIAVQEDVPVLQGTTATIAGVGFTGVSQINLDGAIRGAPPITDLGPAGAPVIPTKPGALGELLNSAPLLLERLTTLTERVGELLSDRNQQSLSAILANVERLSGSLADRGPEIARTLAETRTAIRQAGDAAAEISKLAAATNGVVASDVRPAMANLNRTIAAAERSATSLEGAIDEARPGIRALSTQTVPEVGQLVRDLSAMSEALTGVANRLNQDGAGSVLGGRKLPDYEP